jgi:hypothetical protein
MVFSCNLVSSAVEAALVVDTFEVVLVGDQDVIGLVDRSYAPV